MSESLSINCRYMVTEVKMNVVNDSDNPLPEYATEGSSGMDIRAYITDEDEGSNNRRIILKPKERRLIHTGLHFEIPLGLEVQLRARSGLALRNGICLANGVATIDSDYTGEVGVILINLGDADFEISSGDRIAQAIVSSYVKAQLNQVSSINETERGAGGFGHTGVK